MEATPRQILALLDVVYETARAPERWEEVLAEVARLLEGNSSCLMLQDERTRDSDMIVQQGFDDAALRAYNAHYGRINPWTQRGGDELVAGRVVVSDRHALPVAELEKTEFYGDFLRPHDILHSANAVLFDDAERTGSLVIQRSARAGSFTDADLAMLEGLLPHFQRAVQLRRQLASLAVQRDALGEGLHGYDRGAILLDAAGRVLFHNPRAVALLDAGDGLAITREGRLAAAVAGDRKAFAAAVRGAASGTGSGGVLRLRRSGRRRPLVVLVSPLPSTTEPLAGRRPAVAVFLDDPEADTSATEAALAQTHGLTPAEARVAAQLMSGADVDRIATELALSVHTVRTHLKRIFAKTDTSKQGELISLLWRTRLPSS